MKITRDSFQKAGEWIKQNACPLEVALWEYKFESGSVARVQKYLSAFQNQDGGFGHGIEPDFWFPHSSPMATWAAGRILIDIEAVSINPMVQSLISYLTKTPQAEPGMWPSVLPEFNQYPHAPWWEWEEGVQKIWMFNPSAELSALLIKWSEKNSTASQLGWNSLEKAVDHLMDSTEMDMHEISNYQMLHKLLKPGESLFDKRIKYTLNQVLEKITCLVEKCVDRDVSNWSQYTALPLNFIDGPDDPLCFKFESLVECNLNYYDKHLTEEGIWNIPWDWNNSFPQEFAVAERYWKGILALERYEIIKSFGRL